MANVQYLADAKMWYKTDLCVSEQERAELSFSVYSAAFLSSDKDIWCKQYNVIF